MRFDSSRGATPRDEAPAPPAACPFCQSKSVGTIAKVITASTYWRCQACGEIWNPARLDTSRYGNRRAW